MISERFISRCSLKGKIALITGGGSGLGYGMAESMIDAGAVVILVGRRKEVLEQACAQLGENAHAYPFDIMDWEGHGSFARQIVQDFGRLDILVNNAGNQFRAAVNDVKLDDFSSTFDVHVKSSFSLTRAFLPCMEEQGSGSVIFMSSMAGFMGLDYQISYAAAKSAIMGLVRTFSSEMSHTGIRFNAIVPGWFETPMMLKAMGNDLPRQQKVLGRTPMRRFGKPEDIGWAAVYLAADASRFVTGTTLVVDGGALTGF